MQVIVKARHTRVPAAMKKMAVEKIEKVKRFNDHIGKLEIEFSEEHNPRVAKRKHSVEVTMSTKNHVFRAVGAGMDPASAIDTVVDKLEAQVKRVKDKMVKRGRTGKVNGALASAPAKAVKAAKSAKANGIESADGVKVRRMGRFSVEPMTPKEAALLIEGTGEEFLPFVNADTDLVSVVYRRAGGGYGLLEPAE